MASGYLKNGVDLDDLCEPYVASKAVNSNNQDLSTFSVNGTAMTSRYQKANTDTWANIVTLPLRRDGVAVQTVAKGCFPTQTKFAEITSAGTYSVSRTDDSLTIGSTSYPASHFRNGVVPKYIGIILAGAGGGGGGFGAETGDKDGFNRKPSGAGGGGGISTIVCPVDSITSITIGAGGAGGSWGSGEEDSRPSTGSKGTDGGQSKMVLYKSDLTSRDIPDEYIPLEYIESNGTQYIETNMYIDNQSRIEMVVQTTSTTDGSYICYSGNENGLMVNCCTETVTTNGNSNSVLAFDISTSAIISGYWLQITPSIHYIDIDMHNSTVSIEDRAITSGNTLTNYTVETLKLFGNGSVGSFCRLYECVISHYGAPAYDFYEDRHYIPVQRKSDGVCGLYDLVGEKFYTNSGSGSFIAGPMCDAVVYCQGGSGGFGGNGDDQLGKGGMGGYNGSIVYTSTFSNSIHIGGIDQSKGGDGGTPNTSGGGATSLTNFSFTSGAGVATSTIFNNASTGQSYSSDDSYRSTWTGGGCSFGSGGTNSVVATKGGGGCSNSNSNGADGYCAFYY